jgi:hypothetical protein
MNSCGFEEYLAILPAALATVNALPRMALVR